jgi:mannose-1-phosphate guanylyltransferase
MPAMTGKADVAEQWFCPDQESNSLKAMILAAGLATRLRPLSLTRPKVLMPVQNRPLLLWLVEYLYSAGAEEVMVNAHHLAEKVVEYITYGDFPIPVQVRVEKTLLGTGGGIRNVLDFWDDRPFVVMNGDILSSIDLRGVFETHQRSGAIATLVLKDDPRFNVVRVADDGRILSFTGGGGNRLGFTGIQVLSPRVLSSIPAEISLSIIDGYLKLIAKGEKVMAHVSKDEYWRELGNLPSYFRVHQELFQMQNAPLPGLHVDGIPVVHESARLGSNTRFDGMVCLGAECRLSPGVTIESSVIWDKVQIGSGCSIRESIVGDGVMVTDSLEGVAVGTEGRVQLTAGS